MMGKVKQTIKDRGTLLKGIHEVAEYYQYSVSTVRQLVDTETIPGYRIGDNTYFHTAQVDDALLCYGSNANKEV